MTARAEKTERSVARGARYRPPEHMRTFTLQELLHRFDRAHSVTGQMDLLRAFADRDVFLYCAGNIELLRAPTVSVVGTRQISPDGIRRATKLARQLAEAGVLVMSGLAKGVDTIAHTAAIEAGGHTAAVVGTPIDRVYPAENADLQTLIYSQHLLVTPFNIGEQIYRSNFPLRNKVMALLSDATVIIEASDTSGTLHQAAECQRSNRWLFILRSVVENSTLTWPARFLGHPKTRVVTTIDDILSAVNYARNQR